MTNQICTYFVVPSECLDWHKALKNCDSQCFVHTNFFVSTIYIINIKGNNNSLMCGKNIFMDTNVCKLTYCNRMCTYTQTLDRHAAQIDVYTQAHTAHNHTQTHTQVCMHTMHRTCACTERAHTQCAFTQRVHKHRENKHTTLCDNNTGHTCIKSGAHQIHTHTYHQFDPKRFLTHTKRLGYLGIHSISVFHSRRWK